MVDKLRYIKDEVKRILQESVLEQKLKIGDFSKLKQKELLQRHISSISIKLLRQKHIVLEEEELNKLKEEILTELIGFGIIDKLIKDPEITDILVNSPNQIYIEKKGKLERIELKFNSQEEIASVIERMMRESGKRLNVSSPFVDFRTESGERVTAVIPPVSPSTSLFCIRKILKDIFTFADLKRFGTLNQQLLDFLKYCVQARLNILVSGSTGVGKTTLMNLLIREFIPKDERIVIIEDTEEIAIKEPNHFIRLITRAPTVEGKGEITLKDLVRLSLHLRPDRVIVGEVRGEETFHFLHAINTGHEGSICTIHANNSEDALNRVETLALMDRANIHPNAIRRFLKWGIDLIIHMVRFPTGQRIITQVSEFDYKGDYYTIKDIFSLERKIKDDKEVFEIKLTGNIPSCIDKLKARTAIPADFFNAP